MGDAMLDQPAEKSIGAIAFCGKPRWLCDRLRIGLTAQHVTPYVFGGVAGPLIPFCARCQAMSAAALQETRNVVGEITRLDDVNGDQRTPSVPGRPVAETD